VLPLNTRTAAWKGWAIMKTRSLIYALVLVLSISSLASALKIGGSDDDLSVWVEQLSIQAKADLGLFKTELSVEFGVPVAKVEQLITEVQMEPGDVYVSLELARISEKPVDEVVEVYKVNKKKGWGAMAKELGIKPGSPEFKALKENAKEKSKGKKK